MLQLERLTLVAGHGLQASPRFGMVEATWYGGLRALLGLDSEPMMFALGG
jgi:hypothetical protein